MAYYAPNQTYSSFSALPRRAKFPGIVREYLKEVHGYTSMADFCQYATKDRINQGRKRNRYGSGDAVRAYKIWVEACTARTDLVEGRINPEFHIDEEERPMEKTVNADRNEMIALLQGAKGAQFVTVEQSFSRLVDDEYSKNLQGKSGPLLTYKAVDLDLKQGDVVVVQYRERYGIGIVHQVLLDVPTSDEYDFNIKLRHVIQKIDTHRSAQLEELDRQMLRKITASEASDRLERLTRQLGMDMDKITLTLPEVGEK